MLRGLAVVGIVFVALPAPLDAAVRARLMGVPLLAAAFALDEVFLRVLREDGLVQPLIAHRIELRARLRVGLKNLFTGNHISHNRNQYNRNSRNVNPFFHFFSLFFYYVTH